MGNVYWKIPAAIRKRKSSTKKRSNSIPLIPVAYNGNLGNVYKDTRRYSEAEKQFKKAIQLDSTYTYPYNNLGLVYKDTRRYEEAEKQYKKAIQLDSTFTYPYNNLGIVYLNTHRYVGSGKAVSKKRSNSIPLIPYAYNGLGNVYKDTRRYSEAEKQLQKSDPTRFHLYLCLQQFGIFL